MRKAAWVAAAVAAILLLLAIVLPRVVSLDGLRPRLVAVLEEKTGRKATISKVSLTLFPGVGVKVRDLSLSGDPGHESEKLLDAPEAEIRLAILPLLSGRAEFNRLILARPNILFRKYADGTTSISEMVRRLSQPAVTPAPAGEGGLSFAVHSLDIRDARVAFRLHDQEGRETAWDVSPVTARLTGAGAARYDFDVSARIGGRMRGHISLAGRLEREQGGTGVFLLKADGDLFHEDLSVEGKIVTGGSSPEMDLALSMPDVRLGDLSELFRDPPVLLARARPEGFGSLSAKLSGTPENLGFEIDVDLRKAGWTVTPGLQKFIDTPCALVVQGHRFPDQLVLSNAELRYPPLLLIGNLSLVPSSGAFEWSASSRIASLADFAKSRGELLQRWSPTGMLTASGGGKRAGKGSPTDWSVGIDLGDVGFQHEALHLDFRSLDGHLVLTPGSVEFAPLAGLFNGQSFSLRGKLAQGDTAAWPLELKMAYFDLDALFPAGGHGEKGHDAKGAAPKAGEAGIAEKQRFAFLANLSIDAGRAQGIEFRDLSGQVRFEKGVHSFEKLKARIFGGEAEATGRIDTGGRVPGLKANVALKNVDLARLLARKTAIRDFVSGSVTMSVDLSGKTRTFAEFSRTVAGGGTVSVSGGKIRGIDLTGEAAKLAGLSAVVPAMTTRETPFSKLSANFQIGGGKIRTDSLRIDSDRLELNGSAVIGFDKTLDFVGTVRLPASISGRGRDTAGRYLSGPGGRIEVPLVVSGALTSPDMAIDSGALAKGKKQ